MLFLWFLYSFCFLYFSTNLLLSLIIIELLSFIILFFVSVAVSMSSMTDFLVVFYFSLFVVEGVIALSGFIFLVSFSGSDYMSSFSFSKF